jgi:hypothetical protein
MVRPLGVVGVPEFVKALYMVSRRAVPVAVTLPPFAATELPPADSAPFEEANGTAPAHSGTIVVQLVQVPVTLNTMTCEPADVLTEVASAQTILVPLTTVWLIGIAVPLSVADVTAVGPVPHI